MSIRTLAAAQHRPAWNYALLAAVLPGFKLDGGGGKPPCKVQA